MLVRKTLKREHNNNNNNNVKGQVIADVQQIENVALEMNIVNTETDNTLKQSSNDSMKFPVTENK